MRLLFSGFIFCTLLAVTCSIADTQKSASALPPPAVRPAIDGILAAFQDHPLVGLGDAHEIAQEEDFYAALVRDPRFARDVGNVVVEFGDATDQNIIDRYLKGQDVSFSDLRKVWTDGVGFNFPAAIGYVNFFAQVRAVNLTLPPSQRIYVWLGDPPINWSKLKTKDEFQSILRQRDTYPAALIEREILKKNRRALVIYGDPHFYCDCGFRKLIEKERPNAFFIVQMYTGYATKACTANFERKFQNWPTPAVMAPVRSTSLEEALYQPNCDLERGVTWRFKPSVPESVRKKIIEDTARQLTGADADALLYLGKAGSLTYSPIEPSIYLDPDYRREMNRRQKAGFEIDKSSGEPLTQPLTDSFVETKSISPQYIHHY